MPKPEPWERQKGETVRAYGHFLAYRDAPVPRTVVGVARDNGFTRQNLNILCQRFKWVERCLEWDNHHIRVRQDAADRESAKHAARWERRRLDDLERAHGLGVQLQEQAKAMLDAPLYEMVGEAKMPAKWVKSNAATFAKVGAELTSMATTMALDDLAGIDPLSMSPEECQQLLAKLSAKGKAVKEELSRSNNA